MSSSHLQVVPTNNNTKTTSHHHHQLDIPWFALPYKKDVLLDRCLYTEGGQTVYTEEEVEMYPLYELEPLNLKLTKGCHELARPLYEPGTRHGEPDLPRDPRVWSREQVCAWVLATCANHSLPAPNTERFLMNGKAVCLMSLNMFISRVPLGGKLLYRDFQIRLGQAIHN